MTDIIAEPNTAQPTIEQLQAELDQAKAANRELKLTVVKTARKYAVAHGLCAVVDDALTEAGLGPRLENIEITLHIPTTIKMHVDAGLLEDMDQDQRKVFIAQQLRPALLTMIDLEKTRGLVPAQIGVSGSPRAGRMRPNNPVVEIGDISIDGIGMVPEPEVPADPWHTPVGYMSRFSSRAGRVVHYYQQGDNRVRSLCGSYEYVHNLTEHSARSENRVCPGCERAASHMTRNA